MTTTQNLKADEMCGPAGNTARNNDMNITWTCHRNAVAYSMIVTRQDIERTEARIATRRSTWQRRNLTKWVAEANERFDRDMANIEAQNLPCTCTA